MAAVLDGLSKQKTDPARNKQCLARNSQATTEPQFANAAIGRL
jgi:hypothetical protein